MLSQIDFSCKVPVQGICERNTLLELNAMLKFTNLKVVHFI